MWTVNIEDKDALEKALEEISQMNTLKPYLPYEYTCEGMLQRLNTYIENQVS